MRVYEFNVPTNVIVQGQQSGCGCGVCGHNDDPSSGHATLCNKIPDYHRWIFGSTLLGMPLHTCTEFFESQSSYM